MDDGEDSTGERAFAGMVFTNQNFSDALWKALAMSIEGGGGEVIVVGDVNKKKTKRKKGTTVKRGDVAGTATAAVTLTPTHVVVKDNSGESIVKAAKATHPAAVVVTHSWVLERKRAFDAKRKKTNEVKREQQVRVLPAEPTIAVSSGRLPLKVARAAAVVDAAAAATATAAAASNHLGSRHDDSESDEDYCQKRNAARDDDFPSDHPNWALVHAPVATTEDHMLYGRTPGSQMNMFERVMQCRYNATYSLNEDVVELLVELEQYERFGGGEKAQHEDNKVQEHLNEMELSYARAAAVVRALPYRLRSKTLKSRDLPFLGESMRTQIGQMVRTGTSKTLEAFRMGEPPTHTTSGKVRPINNAAAQRNLQKLPSLGINTAANLISLGIKTLSQLKDDVDAGGQSLQILNATQRSCLEFYEDLTGKVTADDVMEMNAAVLEAARSCGTTVDDAKWEVITVGGSRRSDASHDADFLVAHPDLPRQSQLEGILKKIVLRLGRKIMGGEAAKKRGDEHEHATAFHILTDNKMDKLWKRLKEKDDTKLSGGGKGFSGNADYFDKLYGIFVTESGVRRRIDIVLVPYRQLPYAMIG